MPRDLVLLGQLQLVIEGLSGLIVIDEIQRGPDLFPLLRYLVDHKPEQRCLILGSASRNLLRRFWTMLCHYHGQILNHSELARSYHLSEKASALPLTQVGGNWLYQ